MESDRLSHEEGSRGVTRRAWCSKSHHALEPNLGGPTVVPGLGVGHAGSASLSLLTPRQHHRHVTSQEVSRQSQFSKAKKPREQVKSQDGGEAAG